MILDTASPDLIEKWTGDGNLPNLRRLRERGAYGRIDSVAAEMTEAVPYALFSGQNPAATGLHNYSMWRKETMNSRQPGPDWLPYRPFWRSFREGGPRAIVLDPSNVYPLEPFNGAEVIGWATQHRFAPYQSQPPDLAAWIHARFGSSLLHDEMSGMLTKVAFLRERRLLLDLNRRFRDLCLALMQKESWNLFLASNATLHDAGHHLWNTVNIRETLSEADTVDLNDSVRRVYAACDETVGALVDAVDKDTLILIFSLHGMGVNTSRNWVFPEMLRRILGDGPPRASFLKRLRNEIPVVWRHAFKSRLPHHARRGLTRYWAMKDYDWRNTRAFAPVSDMHAWVRVNLKGREAGGIVEPGPTYETLCAEISEGVRTFVDADSGERIIQDVIPTSGVFHGERLADLPDLIVRWVESPAHRHRAISSPRYGVIPWPTPGRNPDGRSGNHRPQGMLIAAGAGIRAGDIPNASIYDMAPTILSLLDQPIPSQMEGKALQLFGQGLSVERRQSSRPQFHEG